MFASVSKRVFGQNFSYENKFDLHENELVVETHINKNGFSLRIVLTQRQTKTRKAAIVHIWNGIGELVRNYILETQFRVRGLLRHVPGMSCVSAVRI